VDNVVWFGDRSAPAAWCPGHLQVKVRPVAGAGDLVVETGAGRSLLSFLALLPLQYASLDPPGVARDVIRSGPASRRA
jgi:hypothetical protein